MNGFIYKITNNINDKLYIGKTLSSIEKRFSEHINDSKKKQEQSRPLYRAMNKYGSENFQIEIIEECPINILSEREIYWIKFYNSYKFGYNATKGGDGKQLYDYQKIVDNFLNGQLVCELSKEFECSQDTIINILKLANINPRENSNKRSQKKIKAINNDNTLLKEFSSRTEAAKWLQENNYTKSNNLDNIIATIGRAANGKRKSAYGLKWENS